MSRRNSVILLVVGFILAAVAMPAAAGEFEFPGLLDTISSNPCDVCEFAKLLANIKNLLILIGEPLAALFIVIGGIRITISGGNKALVEKGKNTVTNAIIGLFIILLAWIIVTAILTATMNIPLTTNLWTLKCPENTDCETYAGPEPEDNPEGCGSGSAEAARKYLEGQAGRNTCYGPCHCAYFVTRVLEATGCTGIVQAAHENVFATEAWLESHGWKRVISPQAGDVGVDVLSHIGIMTGPNTAIHSKVMNADGSNTPCVGECGKYNESCPECEGAPGDPRGSFVSQRCQSNQCITEEPKTWSRYWRPPDQSENP